MQEKVQKTIEKYQLLEEGERVVLAVSGGPDSVALLHVLLNLAPLYHLSLHVAHLNHMFRGEEARADAVFVAALAQSYRLPATIASRDVPALRRKARLSAQEAARKARYQFLEEVARATGAQKIALGHQADDQAETVLLNFLRGSGLAGLGGMPPRRGKFIRPLIEVTRKEIETYNAYHHLSFREDASNQKPLYLRNRLRHELFPLLLRYNPRLIETLLRSASILQEENAYLEAEAQKAFLLLTENQAGRLSLSLAFLSYPPALQRRLVRLAYETLLPESKGLSFAQVEKVRTVAQGETGKSVLLPQGVKAVKSYGKIVFTLLPEKKEEFCLPLQVPGETCLFPFLNKKMGASFFPWDLDKKISPSPHEAYLDLAQVSLPLWVRSRRPGDVFWPLGAPGRKKLKDFLIDARVPRAEREKIPLVANKQEIVWVAGLRPGHPFRVTRDTKQVLHLELLPLEDTP